MNCSRSGATCRGRSSARYFQSVPLHTNGWPGINQLRTTVGAVMSIGVMVSVLALIGRFGETTTRILTKGSRVHPRALA